MPVVHYSARLSFSRLSSKDPVDVLSLDQAHVPTSSPAGEPGTESPSLPRLGQERRALGLPAANL